MSCCDHCVAGAGAEGAAEALAFLLLGGGADESPSSAAGREALRRLLGASAGGGADEPPSPVTVAVCSEDSVGFLDGGRPPLETDGIPSHGTSLLETASHRKNSRL